MARNSVKVRRNIGHAQRWLNRANKDFTLFKRIVRFDAKAKTQARCSDPALAVYLLQQCIEKAVKSVAIASGQYKAHDFTRFYRHNSLALIINLNLKMLEKLQSLQLGSIATLMGMDLVDSNKKLSLLEQQALGKAPLISKTGEKVSFRVETLGIKAEVIDQLLDLSVLIRTKLLDTIRTTFTLFSGLDIPKGEGAIKDAEEFISDFGQQLASSMKAGPLSAAQLKVPGEFVKLMSSFGMTQENNTLSRQDLTDNYLATWSFADSLLWLSYITYAHEGTARYPLKYKGDVSVGRLGCDDYTEELGIVNRIGQLGRATQLTLGELKREIQSTANLFEIDES